MYKRCPCINDQAATTLQLLILVQAVNMVQSGEALRWTKQTISDNDFNSNLSGLGSRTLPELNSHYEYLDLSSKNLSEFSGLDPEVEFINLKDNNLHKIRIRNRNLRHLYLNNNSLTDLTKLYIPNIEVLTMAGNPIRTIPVRIFESISRTERASRHDHTAFSSDHCVRGNPIRINQITCRCFSKHGRRFIHAQLCTGEHQLRTLGSKIDGGVRRVRSKRSAAETTEPPRTTSTYKSKMTMPYDPMTGIYTAGTLSGMLVFFFLTLLYYEVKKRTKKAYGNWRQRRSLRRKSRLSSIEVGDAVSQQTTQPITPYRDRNKSTVQLTQIRKLDETRI